MHRFVARGAGGVRLRAQRQARRAFRRRVVRVRPPPRRVPGEPRLGSAGARRPTSASRSSRRSPSCARGWPAGSTRRAKTPATATSSASSLERLLRAVGVRIHLEHRDSPAAALERQPHPRRRDEPGVLEADRYVLALGAASPGLVRPLGIRLPIYPLKGYSLTLADRSRAARPADQHHRLQEEDRLRAARRRAARRRHGRSRGLRADDRRSRESPPARRDPRGVSRRVGLLTPRTVVRPRPATPKGTPVLGATRGTRTCCSTAGRARSASRSRSAAGA